MLFSVQHASCTSIGICLSNNFVLANVTSTLLYKTNCLCKLVDTMCHLIVVT